MVERQDIDSCLVYGGQQMILTGQNFTAESKVVFTEKTTGQWLGAPVLCPLRRSRPWRRDSHPAPFTVFPHGGSTRSQRHRGAAALVPLLSGHGSRPHPQLCSSKKKKFFYTSKFLEAE